MELSLAVLTILLFYFRIINETAHGKLLTIPQTKSVDTGGVARFLCSSDLISKRITWKHMYVGGVRPYDVYSGGVLINGYAESGRYSIDIDVDHGRYDLVIRDVQMHDAGEYRCTDEDGAGQTAKAQLLVTEKEEPLPTVPQDTVVVIGHDARITCGSSYRKNVWWKRSQVGSNVQEEIYYGYSGFRNGYATGGRHFVNGDNQTGRYDLVIKRVQPSDAGRYYCVDIAGLGQTKSAELIVLGSESTCSSNITEEVLGENNCGLEPDRVSMFCTVNFTGNIPPGMDWVSSQTGKVIEEGHTSKEIRLSHVGVTLKVKASSNTNWTDFACRTQINDYESVGGDIGYGKCAPVTSAVHTISIIHATRKLRNYKEIETCSVDSLQICKYS